MATPRFTDSGWMTDFGRRPDLEALEVNPPIGYIGDRIYPRTPSRFNAGTKSGITLPQYAAAQTSRTDGQAPTTTLITNVDKSYTCTETIARFGKTAKQTMDTMNIYKVDEQGATGAIYSYMYTMEQMRLTQLVTPIPTTQDNLITASASDSVRSLLVSAFKAMHRYQGRRVLIMGAGMLEKLVNSLDFRTFYQGMPFVRRDSLLDGREQLVSAMQTVFLVDEVLIGDDTILNSAGNASILNDTTVVCAVIPSEPTVTEDSYTYQPELGRTVTYQPYEGLRPFQVESFPDGKDMVNLYTAYGMNAVVEFNPMMKRIVDLTDANLSSGNTVSITGGTVFTINGGTQSA